VTSALLVHGPFGIICALLIGVCWRLYRDREADRAAWTLKEKEWIDRIIVKAETWMVQYHELAKSMNAVLESMAKRIERKKGGGE